jgi:hypothetical protein
LITSHRKPTITTKQVSVHTKCHDANWHLERTKNVRRASRTLLLFVAIEHTWLTQANENTLQQHAHCLAIGNSNVANEATQTLADKSRDKPRHTNTATENNPERKLRKLKTPRTLTSPHAQLYPAVTRKQKNMHDAASKDKRRDDARHAKTYAAIQNKNK